MEYVTELRNLSHTTGKNALQLKDGKSAMV
jgi:hypothetical protein